MKLSRTRIAHVAITGFTCIVAAAVLELALAEAGWDIGWWIVLPLWPLCWLCSWAVEKAA